MSIDYPYNLWYLLGLPFIVLFFVLEYLHTKRSLRSLGGRWSELDFQTTLVLKWLLSMLLFSAFFIFSVLALAGFRWGEQPVEQDRQGIDLVFLMDVSRSMEARDLSPSRRERALQLIQGVVQELKDARFALIVFKGEALRIIPVTEDSLAISNALPSISPELIDVPGTNLPAAVNQAIAAFSKSANRHQLILLLSDGENFSSGLQTSIEMLRRQGSSVYAIGIGTAEGAPIPDGRGGTILNSAGETVITRLESAALEQLAQASGGRYIPIQSPGIFEIVIEEIKKYRTQREQEGFRLESIERDRLFIGLALLCLVLYILVRSLRWRRLW